MNLAFENVFRRSLAVTIASAAIFTGACFFAAKPLMAQAVSTSQINGTVQDASGLAVPGAQVSGTQTDTGLTRSTTTRNDGSYVLSNLPIGPWTLDITKDGFNKYVQSGIVLQVSSNPTIDAVLKVGAVIEQVEVHADARAREA